MTAVTGPTTRDVVPRWRSLQNTIAAGEFVPLGPPRALTSDEVAVVDRLTALWHAEESEVAAAELLAGAVVIGSTAVPSEALELAAKSEFPAVRRLADTHTSRHGLTRPIGIPPSTTNFETPEARRRIALLKRRLILDPYDAIAWTESSRYYAALGQHTQAERAMRVAVTLAPSNRFVLRAAACFYTHSDEPEQALGVLRAAPNVQRDPWLIAAELSVAGHMEMRPATIKSAKALAKDGDLPAAHLTEIRSELATLELRAGGDRRARQMFNEAITDATENSLAQVEWGSHKIPSLIVDERVLDVPLAAEARMLHARDERKWDVAVEAATHWLDDQPFSDDAAVAGSYLAASALRDFARGEALARRGLRSHPHNVTLLNNLAYSLLEQGRTEEAAKQLDGIRVLSGSEPEHIAVAATYGMLRFRQGHPEEGKASYEAAIKRARALRRPDEIAMASVMLAREQLRSGFQSAADFIAAAVKEAARTSNPVVQQWLDDLVKEQPPTS